MMTPKQRGHLLTFDVGSLVNRFDGDNVAVIFAPIHRGGICLPNIDWYCVWFYPLATPLV